MLCLLLSLSYVLTLTLLSSYSNPSPFLISLLLLSSSSPPSLLYYSHLRLRPALPCLPYFPYSTYLTYPTYHLPLTLPTTYHLHRHHLTHTRPKRHFITYHPSPAAPSPQQPPALPARPGATPSSIAVCLYPSPNTAPYKRFTLSSSSPSGSSPPGAPWRARTFYRGHRKRIHHHPAPGTTKPPGVTRWLIVVN